MKKQKPIREHRSREELIEYFSAWSFDDKRECINRILQEHPEVGDPFVIDAASDEMLNSAYTGVLLRTDDALRLVEYREPVPTEELVKMLTDAGVTDDNIYDIIDRAKMSDKDYSDCIKSRHVRHTANLLRRYTDILTRNKDIFLLMLPEYSYHSDQVSVVLAFLGEELSVMEQQVLTQMKNIADRVRMKTDEEVTRIYFCIDDVWEKP